MGRYCVTILTIQLAVLSRNSFSCVSGLGRAALLAMYSLRMSRSVWLFIHWVCLLTISAIALRAVRCVLLALCIVFGVMLGSWSVVILVSAVRMAR